MLLTYIILQLRTRNPQFKGFNPRDDKLTQLLVIAPFTNKIYLIKTTHGRLFTIACCDFNITL
jgi:hypothetical protein